MLPQRLRPLRMAAPQQSLISYGGAAVTDPDFADVRWLLHMDGSDDGTAFTDSSSNASTVTRVGTPVTKTGTKKWGSASALIATVANANALTLAGNNGATDDVGNDDFTIEAWINGSTLGASIIVNKAIGTGTYPYQLLCTAASKIQFRGYPTGGGSLYFDLLSTTVLSPGTWYFVQGRRSGSTFALAIDGAEEASASPGTSALYFDTGAFSIGNYSSGASFPFLGYIDDARLTFGTARAFSVPTAAFPNL